MSADNIYRPLDEDKHEIRLLQLLPAAEIEAPIVGRLQYELLDARPRYEAVSYTWGTPELTKPIELCGRSLSVTANLDQALRHLRLTDQPRTLWVDALCINQQDVAERAHQVTLMKQIYERCTTDLVWLGPNPSEKELEEEIMDKGIQLMEKISSRDITTLAIFSEQWDQHEREELLDRAKWRRIDEMRGKGLIAEGEYIDVQDADVEEEVHAEMAKARGVRKDPKWFLKYEDQHYLRSIVTSPAIWRRVWVMQELSCAPKVHLIAGRRSLAWDVLAKFLGDPSYSDAFHGAFSHGMVWPIVGEMFTRVRSLVQQRRIVADVRKGEGHESSLLDVLARFRDAQSTDPRDKIYGLLGLMTDTLGLEVSYEKTPQQIYANVTACIINHTGNLDIICQSLWRTFEKREQRMAGLPSWAADFTVSGEVLLFAQRSIFNAGRPSCEVPCRLSNGFVLHTKGIIVGHIGKIRQKDYESNDWRDRYGRYVSRGTLPLTWMELYTDQNFLSEEAARYPTGESAFTAFWRTLMTDCVAYPMRRLDEAEIDQQDAVLRTRLIQAKGEPREPSDEDYDYGRSFGFQNLPHNEMDRMYTTNISKWTFATMGNGLYIMIVPPAREGDVIACLDGGKVPVVLRPAGDKDSGGEKYQLVTVAYVHGFMDMEAFESTQLRQRLGLQEQEILIA